MQQSWAAEHSPVSRGRWDACGQKWRGGRGHSVSSLLRTSTALFGRDSPFGGSVPAMDHALDWQHGKEKRA